MRRRHHTRLPLVYEARNLFNTPGAGTSNQPVINRVEMPGTGTLVQLRTMDPPRQNNNPSQHVPTPPGHYSNPLDNMIAAVSRLAALPIDGESPTAVETRRARELLQTALTQQQAYFIVVIGFIPPIARAEVTADILMSRRCQEVDGAITRRMGITRWAVVLMLRMWWIKEEPIERLS